MRPIKARVSNNLLKKAPLLFNQEPRILLQEILQNCRRAGAKLVTVTTAGVYMEDGSDEQCRITIEDDGHGIRGYKTEDTGEVISGPQSLLFLGSSGWDEETQGLESPAGMGFFSLCHLTQGVTVESANWRIHLTPEVFRGEVEVEVEPEEQQLGYRKGTKVEFVLPVHPYCAVDAFRSAAFHYPVPVKLNGTLVPYEDFLKDAKTIVQFDGGRIGIVSPKWHVDACANFYGVPVRLYRLNMLPGDDYKAYREYEVRIDIADNTLLDMVLPDRTQPVRNEKLQALKVECRKAVYKHIVLTKAKHHLPYEHYLEAREFGYDMHEAEATLRLELPRPVSSSNFDWPCGLSDGYCDQPERLPVTPESILSGDLDRADIAALHLTGVRIPQLFRAQLELEGYSWYPQFKAEKVITGVEFGDGTVFYIDPDADDEVHFDDVLGYASDKGVNNGPLGDASPERPKDIFLQLVVAHKGTEQLVVTQYPAFLIFDPDAEGSIRGNWLPVQGNKAAAEIDADVLAALFFWPNGETDGDSWETQHDKFYDDANSELVEMFEGEEAARLHDIHKALDTWDMNEAFKALKAKLVVLAVDMAGVAKITSITPHEA